MAKNERADHRKNARRILADLRKRLADIPQDLHAIGKRIHRSERPRIRLVSPATKPRG